MMFSPQATNMRMWRRVMYACLALAMMMLMIGSTSVYADGCGASSACYPWFKSGPACSKGGRISLRFMLDMAPENAWGTPKSTTAVYGLCPMVDELQSFTLNNAGFLAGGYTTKKEEEDDDGKSKKEVTEYHLSTTMTRGYLRIYGLGSSNNTLFPDRGTSAGATVVAVNGASICGSSASLAVVTTLILQIGVHKGLLDYGGASAGTSKVVENPTYNPEACTATGGVPNTGVGPGGVCDKEVEVVSGEKIEQPLMTGFVPTCTTADVCQFGNPDTSVCIGDVGQKNCGVCISDVTQLKDASINMWTSYYGTDSSKHAMTSGGENPINALRYGDKAMLNTMGSKLRDLWDDTTNDMSFVDLPNWPFN